MTLTLETTPIGHNFVVERLQKAHLEGERPSFATCLLRVEQKLQLNLQVCSLVARLKAEKLFFCLQSDEMRHLSYLRVSARQLALIFALLFVELRVEALCKTSERVVLQAS